MLELCYSGLSPFARKVRMVMDYKGVEYGIFDSCDVEKYPMWNPRAEIPILRDGNVTVCNSADIVGYLDRKHPDRPVLPADPAAFAVAREWERTADTLIDAIVTDVAIWQWADLPPMPEGFLEASRLGLAEVYSGLAAVLADRDFVAEAEPSVADFALYPHLSAAQLVGLRCDPITHAPVIAWLKRMRVRDEVQRDLAEVRAWWAGRATADVETQRINWGTHRLEWLLAHGHSDWFAEQVRAGRVLWSVGPNNNARRSPLARAGEQVAA